MQMIKKIMAFSPVILLLGACTTTTAPTPNIGASLQESYNKQVVTYTATQGAPIMDPQNSAAAIQRFHDDKVKQPKESSAIKANE